MKINTLKDEYIIIEIIPTALNPEKGIIAQLSALKLKGLELIDRFDYRANISEIANDQIKKMISYDEESFKYIDSKKILDEFRKWSEDLPILFIDNEYTINYIKEMDNYKEDILSHLDLKCTNDVFDIIIKKYNLVPSNYIVDLLYEALIYESNK